MYIYSVIPLTNIPRPHMQKPSYFSSEKLEVGQLIEVPLASRLVPAIVAKRTNAQSRKQLLKRSPYVLKNIKRVLVDRPIFSRDFLKLAEDLADYYFVSVGLMLKRMLPPFFSKPTRPLLKALSGLQMARNDRTEKYVQKILIIGANRKKYYKKYLADGRNIFLVPRYFYLEWAQKILKDNFSILPKSATQTQWRKLWIDAYSGALNTVAGTRSVLFMPVRDCRNIIIEKENDSSYVSWDQHPKFDARYAAELLTDMLRLRLVEGDSIPSINKWQKAQKEKWLIIKNLKNTKGCEIIDMKKELKSGNSSIISKNLREKLRSLKKGQKALLFINRRGLSSALLCRDCGYVIKCPNCDTAAVLHQEISRKLVCHRCGVKIIPPSVCPNCDSYKIKHLGGGTQRVLQEVQKIIPQANIARIDKDAAPDPETQKKILEDFKKGKYQVLIGTQIAIEEEMFADLDLVAVVMADTVLSLPSYQSYENVYETIWRLKNISKNNVLIQTYLGDLSLFKFLQNQDFEEFFNEELSKRKKLKWPPFSHLIKLVYSNKDAPTAEREAASMARKLEVQLKTPEFKDLGSEIEILGPAPAFIPKVAGYYIWNILIKWPIKKNGEIKNIKTRNILLGIVPSRYWEVDVDPIDIV
ncbi:MAG: primosomal protein N' [Candidatus Spechtbacteria bacterium]|nr:primosomal protein N' [Candidatus Spechtbacteria bacterium]